MARTSAPTSSSLTVDDRMQEIYDGHRTSLLRSIHRWTGDWQTAEDLMQETMLRAWRHLDTLNPDPDALRPWLVTVARRIVIDRNRARSARPPEADISLLDGVIEAAEPIERVLARETLREVLAGLSETHRRALVEVYLRDKTVPEAAADLGVPEGTLKSRVYYALRGARKCAA